MSVRGGRGKLGRREEDAMSRRVMWSILTAALALAAGSELVALRQVADAAQRNSSRAHARTAAGFSGSTPCDPMVRALLGIPANADAHLMEWKLTLHDAPAPGASANYHLTVRYGTTVPGRPGLGPGHATLEREGTWSSEKRDTAGRVVYALNGAVGLAGISDDVLHLLNADGSLMVGNGGWSYTLNRDSRAEPRLDPLLATAGAESRTVSPLASGPSVYGVFEGRTPCQGIARQLNIVAPHGCAKAKWRVTLFHDPDTRRPTRYKIESGLHPGGAREGEWTIVRGMGANTSVAYRLNAAPGEPALFLLRGDENVLFFLDQQLRPLTGHWEFSYTLNRRPERQPPSEAEPYSTR